MDNFISADVVNAEEKIKKLGLTVVKLGSGKYVINQYPEKGSMILSGNKVFLVTNDVQYTMPDITGWSNSEVNVLCRLLGIGYKSTGYGVVKMFTIPVGTVLTNDSKLEVVLG